MTEKIAWLEEVLRLEPNSKLFFPLAQAYTRNQRPHDAVALLRKGLTSHPEHLEARLLLIECLSELDAVSLGASSSGEATPGVEALSFQELESLTAVLAGHPAFWKLWAAGSRAQGRTDLAVTLDMLAVQLSGTRLSWGTLLEQGLRAVIGGREDPPSPGPLDEQVPTSPEPSLLSMPDPEPEAGTDTDPKPAPGPDITPDASHETELKSETPSLVALKEPPEAEAFREEESLDMKAPEDMETLEEETEKVSGVGINELLDDAPEALGQTTQAPPVYPVDPEAVDEPSPEAEGETPLSEGERRYYETKTYADLLAKQGEHEEALGLYAKLLQTSPDDEQRRDLEARIQELRDRAAKSPREPDSHPTDSNHAEPRTETETKPGPEPKVEPVPDLEAGQSTDQETISRGAKNSAASPPTSPSPKTETTKQTLKKLAERLESRAEK
ncbi:tetratricopeptide repeat protein [Desulfonatronum sp. SC1]|uniref:tetratricopeptide repeat protein n=1 Tax=Desulfonatronum sp. SC1 TaxID=2109626 RepID=UPI000D325690|nr:tetratricopeptide repeat protein [Desulfonatronum sp. SC1]PTN38041.1 hypothetical protein C6366_04035 [Desulfonatronum sp. SC1]